MKKKFKIFDINRNLETNVNEWLETISPNAKILEITQMRGHDYLTFLYTE